MVKQLTPILVVEAIEPGLPFWTERLGFAILAQVPLGDRLGFAILARDGVEVMFQTRASIADDLKLEMPVAGGLAYFQVADLQPIVEALAGADVVVPRRKTFYGADEIFVREPGGNLVGFSAHAG